MGTRRKFTKEFKLSVLQELETKPMAEICRMHDLSPSTVCTWRKEFETDPEKAFSGNGNLCKYEARIAELERLLGQSCAREALLKRAYESLKQQQIAERKKKTA